MTTHFEGHGEPSAGGIQTLLATALKHHDLPLLPLRILVAGSLTGFTDNDAQAVLLDNRSVAYLNGLWTTYKDHNDGQLPPVFLSKVMEERSSDGPSWNLGIAHAAGYCWSEQDMTMAVTQFLHPLPFSPMRRLEPVIRGDESAEEEGEAWQIQFVAGDFEIRIRRAGMELISSVHSPAREGEYEVAIHLSSGEVARNQLVLRRDQTTRWVLTTEAEPTMASIKPV